MSNPVIFIRSFKKNNSFYGHFKRAGFVFLVFGVIGLILLLYAHAATAITIDSSLPQVTNVRVYPDDRLATVTWDEPAGGDAAGLVGYFVEWGETALGTFPNTKQTTDPIAQIQPLENNKQYTVRVYAAHGTIVQVDTPGAHEPGTAPEARGDGRVSPFKTINVTPSSARVDQLRTQMTGFFDDFNTGVGAFDELKWNQAVSACGEIGSAGAFVNNQFHVHNQIKSIERSDDYCDRAQIASRARGIFDITGRTESNPGEIVFDMDGLTRQRDVWYLDLIPDTARTDGTPIDITSHNSAFDDQPSDPMTIRIVQGPLPAGAKLIYFDKNKTPHDIVPTYTCGGNGNSAELQLCDPTIKTAGMSPLPQIVDSARCIYRVTCLASVPNVRRNWKMQVTTSKIKVFVDGVRILEADMPSDFTSVVKYQVHSTVFSYNTGKGDTDHPTTTLLHWDNFGFNGPAQSTVVHNYIDSGLLGTTPYLGRGNAANPLLDAPRNTRIVIPDPLGSPAKVRLMFTLQNHGSRYYIWQPTDNIVVNGTKYNLPNPTTKMQTPYIHGDFDASVPEIGSRYTPFAITLPINLSDLKQGNNDLAINIPGANGTSNVHIELEYNKGSEPAYTQPRAIFGEAVMNSFVRPAMSMHDSYLFVEQNLGLVNVADHGSPMPTMDIIAPSVSLTSPASGATVATSPVVLSANASDNVGVTRVDFSVDGNIVNSDNTAPYTFSWDVSAAQNGSHTVQARAYDAANLSTATGVQNFSVNIATAPPPSTGTGVGTGMPLISRSAPASASSNGTNSQATHAQDALNTTYWTSASIPGWLAYDLSGTSSASRQQVLVALYAERSNDYDNTGNILDYQAMPLDYVIEGNTASGGGAAPASGWTALATVTNNVLAAPHHLVQLNGANWLRVRVTRASSPTTVSLDVDVYSAPNGGTDDWLFLGDSITSMTFQRLFQGTSVAQRVNNKNSARWPGQIGGGTGGTNTVSAQGIIDARLAAFPGKYVVLAYGTNDGAGDFRMESLIQKVISAGKTPVVPTVPWPNTSDLADTKAINTIIQGLYTKYPQVLKGPDLFAVTENRSDYIPAGDVHPTDAGRNAIIDAYVTVMTSSVTDTSSPPTTTGTWTRIDPPQFDMSLNGVDQFGFHGIAGSGSSVYVYTSYQGIFKTTNGGASWIKTNTGRNGAILDTGRILGSNIHPSAPNTMFVHPLYGQGDGIWKSTDGGVNWDQVVPTAILQQTTGYFSSIVIDPNDPNHILASGHNPWNGWANAGIIESTDGGTTWILHNPMPTWGANNTVSFIDSTTWLVATETDGFWRTTNRGVSWSKAIDTAASHGGGSVTRTTNAIYVGGFGPSLFRSTDNGANFVSVGPSGSPGGGFLSIGNDGVNLWIISSYPAGRPGELSSPASFFTSPVNDGVNWTKRTDQTFLNGALSYYYDSGNRILYTTNWQQGVWKISTGSGTITPPAPTDITAPSISLTLPTTSPSIASSGSFTATATASDSGSGVSRVEFLIDGQTKYIAGSSPYTAIISAVGLSAGTHTLSVKAVDIAGNTSGATPPLSFTVQAIAPPPSSRFETLPVGSLLPAESDCANRVKPAAETRSLNTTYNNRRGIGGNYTYPRVTGNYIGTTDELIQWAACKWGMDEDLLRAQIVQESYWFQNAIGDFNSDANNCSPVYPVGNYPAQYNGDSAHSGQCPESVGLLQIRWQYQKSAFYSSQTESQATLTNNAIFSSAYNLDYYGAVWRDCFEGNMGWLNTVERGETYQAGDATGCQGVWFSGRWKTAPAMQYISAVQNNLSAKVWTTSGFAGAQSVNPVISPDSGPTPDTTAPAVSVTSPTSNQSVSGTINVTANATDNQGVTSVSFYLDGSTTPFSTDTTSPYASSWSSATIGNGTHAIAASARDAAGNVGKSSSISFSVSNTTPDTTAPVVSITAPFNNATLSGTTTINVSATDAVGVARVELWINGNLVATDTQSPYSFSWNTTTYANSTHTIQARAVDAANNIGQSASLSVAINNVVVVPSPTTHVLGDVNGDNVVNTSDLSIILKNMGKRNAALVDGDLNGDKTVNSADLSIILKVLGLKRNSI